MISKETALVPGRDNAIRTAASLRTQNACSDKGTRLLLRGRHNETFEHLSPCTVFKEMVPAETAWARPTSIPELSAVYPVEREGWESVTVPKLPALFDVLIVGLLVGGCLLLWLKLRVRKDGLLPVAQYPGDSVLEEKVNPVAARSSQDFGTKDESELRADYGAGLSAAAPAQQADAQAEPVLMAQNHYASSVSAAISRSRKAPVGV
jgi:hypothetical protein